MQTIADIILACGALGVAFYCFVLARRLKRFTNLEHGVGGAVAVLSAQVDDLNRALDKARRAAETSGVSLSELTDRADKVARRLELHVAAMHDLDLAPPEPEVSATPESEAPPATKAEAEAAAPAALAEAASEAETPAGAPEAEAAPDPAPAAAPADGRAIDPAVPGPVPTLGPAAPAARRGRLRSGAAGKRGGAL